MATGPWISWSEHGMSLKEGGGAFTPASSVRKLDDCVIYLRRKRRQWQGGRERYLKIVIDVFGADCWQVQSIYKCGPTLALFN